MIVRLIYTVRAFNETVKKNSSPQSAFYNDLCPAFEKRHQ